MVPGVEGPVTAHAAEATAFPLDGARAREETRRPGSTGDAVRRRPLRPAATALCALLSCLSSVRSGRRRSAVLVSTACAGLALLVGTLPSAAQAHFVRPFIRQIPGPATAPFSDAGPLGLALDGEGRVWVGETDNFQPPLQFDHFDSAAAGNPFLESLEVTPPEPEVGAVEQGLTPPESLAVDDATGLLYLTGRHTLKAFPPAVEVIDPTGTFVRRWAAGGIDAQVALDNSGGPSTGTVYVVSQAPDLSSSIARYTASGEAAAFAEAGRQSYVSANQITGLPGVSFDQSVALEGIAVDGAGDIYVGVAPGPGGGRESEIAEYTSAGAFLGAFAVSDEARAGGRIASLALDPNGDVLVSLVGEKTEAVLEFDHLGRLLGRLSESSAGRPISGKGNDGGYQTLAVDSSGDLYVGERGNGILPSEHGVDVFGPGAFLPGLRLGEATATTDSSADLNGSINPEAAINPEHSGLSKCEFEYVTEAEFEAEGFSGAGVSSVSCSPTAAAITPTEPTEDETWHPVHAAISGLESGVVYRYRLTGGTAGLHGGSATTSTLAFTARHAPRIESPSADNLSSNFADLHAEIDPLGAPTSYRFEYLSAAEFLADGESFTGPDPARSVPVPDGTVGSGGPTGSSPEAVLEHIGSLSAATAYRFRVVAENECEEGKMCVTAGPSVSFATLATVTPGLPDGRAYELVTPAAKGGAEDIFSEPQANGEFFNVKSVGVPAQSGDGFLLETPAAFGPFPASAANAYLFRRDPAADTWTSTSLASPGLGVQNLGDVATDPDLSAAAFDDQSGSGASEAGTRRINLLGPVGGPYAGLHTGPPVHGKEPEPTSVVGASEDLGHVILESTDRALCPGAEAQVEGSHLLCDYTGGELHLLNLTSGGSLLGSCGAVLGIAQPAQPVQGQAQGAVSADGSRVFLTAPDPTLIGSQTGCWNGTTKNAPQLFMRSEGETVEVSSPAEPELEFERGHHLAQYVGASRSGSRVFFLSEAWLTADHPAVHDLELYGYDVETGELTRISKAEAPTVGAAVYNVPTFAADGAAIYFTALSKLTPQATTRTAREELVNLYRYDTGSATTTYVTTVNTYDAPHAGAVCFNLCSVASWETTPDGRFLLFSTSRELTGYGTLGPCRGLPNNGGNGNGHCAEIYRYDAASGAIVCVSCDPSGAPPKSNAQFTRSWVSKPTSPPVRAISANGAYVFFDTGDGLVPQDTNGTGLTYGMLDTYEWHEGAISLISSGHDAAPSFFLGTTPDGSDAFFGTHARLVPADTDDQGDVYDARICTSSDPCLRPPASGSGICEGDACATPSPAPDDATPGSLSFIGPGNLTECARGKTLKKGRCVAERSTKKGRHKKKKDTHKKSSKSKKQSRANSGHGGRE